MKMKMKMDLRLNEENWVALAAVRGPCGFGPDKPRRHVIGCSWHAPYRSACPLNWGILLLPIALVETRRSSSPLQAVKNRR
jgi:hypothetical protein